MRLFSRYAAVALVHLAFLAAWAHAQTATWIGTAANGNWHTASNWSPAIVPGPTSDVVIPAGSGSILISDSAVNVRSLSLGRPLVIALNIQFYAQSAVISSTVTTSGLVSGTYTFLGSGGFSFPSVSSCGVGATLQNVIINGDLVIQEGQAFRWSSVIIIGALRAPGPGARRIFFSGNQVVGCPVFVDPSATLNISAWGGDPAGTLTIASTSTIYGGNLSFVPCNCGDCSQGTGFQVLNQGTIDARAGTVFLSVPFQNFGVLLGNVTVNGVPFYAPFASAGPTDNAVFTGTRPDPGSSGTSTLQFNSLTIQPGSNFTLGSGETLNLNNGTGTLYINPGAVFVSNGTVLGNIYNAGLLVIPITQAGLVFNTTGPGRIDIIHPPIPAPNPTPIPIPVPPAGPPVIGDGSYVSFGGSGFGGTNGGVPGGGSPGSGYPGRYEIPGSPVVRGAIATDGQLDVTGSYTQTPTGVLRLFIAGNTRGITYSLLNVGQTATLAGSVQVVLQPELFNYLPRVGDTFEMIIAAGGLSIDPSGLTVQTLMTRAGAQQIGLNLPTFNSGFLNDPNQLVSWPSNIFSYQLINNNTTMRFTLTAPLCFASATPASQWRCPLSTMTLTGTNPGGSGLTNYLWQLQDPATPGGWRTLTDGPLQVDTFTWGAVAGTSTSTPTFTPAGDNRRSTLRVRTIATSDCGTVTSPAALMKVCPADFDCDQSLQVADVFAFLSAFFANSQRADFDLNTLVEVPDIFAFLSQWFAGC